MDVYLIAIHIKSGSFLQSDPNDVNQFSRAVNATHTPEHKESN